MNVCTFVGKIVYMKMAGEYLFLQVSVPEHYTNSRGEKKVDKTQILLHAYSTAGDYIEKNASHGDTIAVRAIAKNDPFEPCGGYFRINEFQIIKD